MNQTVDERLKRIESRMVQLMYHFGLDPYKKVYDAPHNPDPKTSSHDSCSGESTKGMFRWGRN